MIFVLNFNFKTLSFKLETNALVAHWLDDTPENIAVETGINGVDPRYGFPRTCDVSRASTINSINYIDSTVGSILSP